MKQLQSQVKKLEDELAQLQELSGDSGLDTPKV